MRQQSEMEARLSMEEAIGRKWRKETARKFQIDNYSMEPIQLKVAISVDGKIQTEVFQINRNRTVVEDVVVSKL